MFGGWTSASRKAMLPVVEGANGLLFYPVQYEGLEASKNIYYTGATTNQQIIPAMDFLKSKGVKTLFLAGSDYVFPRTANKIIKQYAKELGIEIVGEEYVPLDSDDWTTQVAKIAAAKPDFVFNTINGSSNVGLHQGLRRGRPRRGQLADHLGVHRRGGGAGHGCGPHRPVRRLELLPERRQPR